MAKKSTKEEFLECLQDSANGLEMAEEMLHGFTGSTGWLEARLKGHDPEIDTILALRREAEHKMLMADVTLARVAKKKLEQE